jgi:hypothetical protein
MLMTWVSRTIWAAAAVCAATSATEAQDRILRIVSADSQPIAYAFVQANGGRAQLSGEDGRVSIGPGKKQTFTIEARRIGYTPFYGKIDLPDTAITVQIVLAPVVQQLGSVRVAADKAKSSLELNGFYKRWLDGQKGVTSALFIGPEEIEKRNTSRVSALLASVNGVTMGRTNNNRAVVTSSAGSCAMAIVLDGRQVCPGAGCHMQDGATTGLTDMNAVLIDEVVDVNSVAAIEVYRRGGNMPSAFHVDGECGAIAIWTGSRKK